MRWMPYSLRLLPMARAEKITHSPNQLYTRAKNIVDTWKDDEGYFNLVRGLLEDM